MDTQDESLRSPESEDEPLIPFPDEIAISDEDARKLQAALNKDGKSYTEGEAALIGRYLLRLAHLIIDPKGFTRWATPPPEPPKVVQPPQSQHPEPRAQPFPIDLDADHPRRIERALEMLADELRNVERDHKAWRWALVALYEAVGHTLALHRPASFPSCRGVGQLTRLFEAVVGEHPEIGESRKAVEEIDRLRTTWITRAVREWPVSLKKLPAIFLDGVQAISRLEPSLKNKSSLLERQLTSQQGEGAAHAQR